MKIRPETIADYSAIFDVVEMAFMAAERSSGDEHNLVRRLRSCEHFIPELSLVAEKNEQIIGHVLLSKIKIVDKDKEHDSLSLAPVSVLPAYQRQGVGKAMIEEALKTAKNLKHKSIIVLGAPLYYREFGFEKAGKYGISTTISGVNDYLMVKELKPGTLEKVRGVVIYPKEFFAKK